MKGRPVSLGLERIRSHPVATYFLLTFLISWSIWGASRLFEPDTPEAARAAVHTAGLCGPTLAAVILSGWLYGGRGVVDLLKRIGRWRVGAGWYLFALFSNLALCLAALAVNALLGRAAPPLNVDVHVGVVLTAGRPEEFGWRGVALPHLLKRRGALGSSLIIAVSWVLWHVPISPMLSNVALLGLFLLEVIPLTVLFSWVYINSRGSILLVVLYHLAANLVVYVVNIPGSPVLWVIYVGLTWLLAALVLARYGTKRLSRRAAEAVERDLWGSSPGREEAGG